MKKKINECPRCKEDMRVVAVVNPGKVMKTKIFYCKHCQLRVTKKVKDD